MQQCLIMSESKQCVLQHFVMVPVCYTQHRILSPESITPHISHPLPRLQGFTILDTLHDTLLSNSIPPGLRAFLFNIM